MAKEVIITGIDIGSSKVRTVVAVYNEEKEKAHVIGLGSCDSLGMRKGKVVDVNEVIQNVQTSLGEAERMSGVPIYTALLSFGGAHVESLSSKGVVAVNGKEIGDYDIERVLEAAQAVSIPATKKILRVIPKEYIVDNTSAIKNPHGMMGTRLEADAHIIVGSAQELSHLEKCISQSGIEISDIIPTPLLISESLLTKRQKELGVIAIDIGSSSTSIIVYEEGIPLHTCVLPIGGESVTSDIAIGLRTSIDTAERIKIEYGTARMEDVSERELIDLSLLSKIDNHKVSQKEMARIIEARYDEIFRMIRDELRAIGKDGMLPSGAMISGGAVKMSGVIDMARDILSLPVQVGYPQNITSVIEKIEDPSYATVIGLVNWGIRHDPSNMYAKSMWSFGSLFGGVQKWFKNLLP